MGIFDIFGKTTDTDDGLIRSCRSKSDFRKLLSASKQKPVFLFKHSTACNVSANAWKRFEAFARTHPQAEYYKVLVIQDRGLSQHIAQKTGVYHQSPQVLLFRNEAVVWDDSHWSITEEKLQDALDKHGETPSN